MGESDQRHSPAALYLPGKGTPVPIGESFVYFIIKNSKIVLVIYDPDFIK
jgi:hypothetical protein